MSCTLQNGHIVRLLFGKIPTPCSRLDCLKIPQLALKRNQTNQQEEKYYHVLSQFCLEFIKTKGI